MDGASLPIRCSHLLPARGGNAATGALSRLPDSSFAAVTTRDDHSHQKPIHLFPLEDAFSEAFAHCTRY
jgi:hypothetical protein